MNEAIVYHGANGDEILGIIQAGAMRPGRDGRIFFSRFTWEHALMHGTDEKRRASFVIKVKVQIPRNTNAYLKQRPECWIRW